MRNKKYGTSGYAEDVLEKRRKKLKGIEERGEYLKVRYNEERDLARLKKRQNKQKSPRQYDGYPPKELTLAKYGLKQEDYDRMFLRQGGACAICFNNGAPLLIDHDHVSGEVRGLLCIHCNSLLGFCNDDVRTLRSAIQYLLRAHERLVWLEQVKLKEEEE